MVIMLYRYDYRMALECQEHFSGCVLVSLYIWYDENTFLFCFPFISDYRFLLNSRYRDSYDLKPSFIIYYILFTH